MSKGRRCRTSIKAERRALRMGEQQRMGLRRNEISVKK
jgi:hypothetical protein